MNPSVSIPRSPSAPYSVLLTDAVFSATSGLFFLLAPGPLGQFLGASPAIIAGLTAMMLGYAALIAYQLTRPSLRRGFVLFTVIGNSGFVLGCLLLLALPAFSFSSPARWAIAAAALCVDVLATFQFFAWRKM